MAETNETTEEMEIPEVNEEPVAEPTVMEGVTATMEVAGIESIPDIEPGRIVLGFARD